MEEESDSEEDEADFVATTVESGGREGTAVSESPSLESSRFRCIMCEKVFRHADNLKVHLQSHLGTRAKLKSCGLCRDVFNSRVLYIEEKNSLQGLANFSCNYVPRLFSPSACTLAFFYRTLGIIGQLVVGQNQLEDIFNQSEIRVILDI